MRRRMQNKAVNQVTTGQESVRGSGGGRQSGGEGLEDLQKAKRATRKAQQRAGRALAEPYDDIFALGPL